jgi:YebC/PmpR family DNA-binding regulatory protein
MVCFLITTSIKKSKIEYTSMSGHSHWSTIKHKKGAADARRGRAFSKMAKLISVAAREGGSDPETNSALRLAIERARSVNFPKENIERAIKQGTGEVEGVELEEVFFEAYGPGGVAIIIEGITDNKNRSLGEVKQVLGQNKSKLAGEGSVRWLFERKGAIVINQESQESDLKNRESLELKVIEAGAEDIYWHDGFLDVYTKVDSLEVVKKNIEDAGIKIESVSLDWVAKELIDVEEEEKKSIIKLFEELDENDTVQEIYSNFKD